MIPEPTPVPDPPNWPRPVPVICEVMVTTESRAAATMPVMSPCSIVVVPPDAAAAVLALALEVAGGVAFPPTG